MTGRQVTGPASEGPVTAAAIRAEDERDHDAVRDVHRLAFANEAEGRLVDALRRSGDAVLSLVAEQDARIVGHILFSRLAAPMRALALAPVGVRPGHQGRGIGSALIREGLERARDGGWAAVFVLGDPAYYGRFGFSVAAAKGYACAYAGDYFMVRALGSRRIPEAGRIVYPAPFADLS